MIEIKIINLDIALLYASNKVTLKPHCMREDEFMDKITFWYYIRS